MRGAWSPTTTHSITNTTQTHLDPPLFGSTSRQHERGSSTESPPIKKPSSFFVARRSWGVQTSTVATKARGESWNVGARMEVAMLRCCRLGTVQWELRLASHEYTLLIIKEDVGGPPWDLDSHVLASRRAHEGKGGAHRVCFRNPHRTTPPTLPVRDHKNRAIKEPEIEGGEHRQTWW